MYRRGITLGVATLGLVLGGTTVAYAATPSALATGSTCKNGATRAAIGQPGVIQTCQNGTWVNTKTCKPPTPDVYVDPKGVATCAPRGVR